MSLTYSVVKTNSYGSPSSERYTSYPSALETAAHSNAISFLFLTSTSNPFTVPTDVLV